MVLIPYERNWNTDNGETNDAVYDVDPELYAFNWVHSTQQEDSKLHSRKKKCYTKINCVIVYWDS